MKLFFECLMEEMKFTLKKFGLLILFIIGIPFLAIWFGGVYDNEYVNDVPIAVLDEDGTSLSRKIVQYFDNSERFDIKYYVSDRKDLQSLIDDKKVSMGLYIPQYLNDSVMTGKATQVLILTDGTNVIIGNNAYAAAAEIVQTVSAGIEIQMISAKGSLPGDTAKNMALSFQFTDRMLYDSKLTYINYLMYGFIAVFFQQLMMSGMATLILRNPEQTAKEKTGIRMAAKITLAAGLLIIAGSYAIFRVHEKYPVLFRGNIILALLLCLLFAGAISCPAILLCALTKDKIKYSQIAYMLSLPTFLTCGYVWPADQMPFLLTWIVKLVWPLINFARPFDEIMIKGAGFETIRQNIINLVLYTIVFMPLSIFIFKRRFSGITDIHNSQKTAAEEINL